MLAVLMPFLTEHACVFLPSQPVLYSCVLRSRHRPWRADGFSVTVRMAAPDALELRAACRMPQPALPEGWRQRRDHPFALAGAGRLRQRRRRHARGLAAADCGGSSITPAPASVLIDTRPACKTLRADIEVLRVEGLPVFGGPQALPAMVQARASRKEVSLGLEGGATVRMLCGVPYRPASFFYAADMGKVIWLLARD